MHFAEKTYIIFLWFLGAGLILLYGWSAKKEREKLAKFAEGPLLPKIAPFFERKRRNLSVALNFFAVLLMVAALARPQWGFLWKENKLVGMDIMLAVDTSKSMLATDVLPSRLEFTRAEIGDFARKLKGDRVGLIAFAGEAFLQCPLTADYKGFFLALSSLNVNIIPRGGTNIPNAIEEALRSFRGAQTEDKVLIIITDGDNTEGNIDKTIEKAKDDKVAIYAIGVGTAEGQTIPLSAEKGRKDYVKDQKGDLVKARLMEDVLKKMATRTGGVYVKATPADFGLEKVAQQALVKFGKKEKEEKRVKAYRERFQLPIALAGVLLFAEFILRGTGVKKK